MDHSKRCAPITMQSNQAARPTRRCDMDVQAIDHTHQEPASVRDIAEKMLAFHTDGTVIATAEVLGLDLNQLWDHFICHTDPTILLRSTDPVVLAYLTVKGFEEWCMDQLADSYTNSEEEP